MREAKAERDINTARLEETADCVLAERIESEYRGLFDRINKELRAEQKRAEDKAKNELKTLEKLNASDHEKLLDGYIRKVVKGSSSKENRGKGTGKKMGKGKKQGQGLLQTCKGQRTEEFTS